MPTKLEELAIKEIEKKFDILDDIDIYSFTRDIEKAVKNGEETHDIYDEFYKKFKDAKIGVKTWFDALVSQIK